MKHQLILKNKETIDCCDDNLVENYIESSKDLGVEITKIQYADVLFLSYNDEGDFQFNLKKCLWENKWDWKKIYQGSVCEKCGNRIFSYLLNMLTIDVADLNKIVYELKEYQDYQKSI